MPRAAQSVRNQRRVGHHLENNLIISSSGSLSHVSFNSHRPPSMLRRKLKCFFLPWQNSDSLPLLFFLDQRPPQFGDFSKGLKSDPFLMAKTKQLGSSSAGALFEASLLGFRELLVCDFLCRAVVLREHIFEGSADGNRRRRSRSVGLC